MATKTEHLALVRARNSAAHLVGSIHDDAVARNLGYKGGIVSGVALYTYLVEACDSLLPPSRFENLSVQMRFAKPIYDGEMISVELQPGAPDGGAMNVTMGKDGSDDVCATFHITQGGAPPDEAEFPQVEVPAEAHEPPEERFLQQEYIGAVRFAPTYDDVKSFLDPLGVARDRWKERSYIHPAYLFRTYAMVSRENHMFDGTASIHMKSDLIHNGLVKPGEELCVKGRTRSLYSERGHRYVVFEMIWVRESDRRPVLFDHHTVIYQRRGAGRSAQVKVAV